MQELAKQLGSDFCRVRSVCLSLIMHAMDVDRPLAHYTDNQRDLAIK